MSSWVAVDVVEVTIWTRTTRGKWPCCCYCCCCCWHYFLWPTLPDDDNDNDDNARSCCCCCCYCCCCCCDSNSDSDNRLCPSFLMKRRDDASDESFLRKTNRANLPWRYPSLHTQRHNSMPCIDNIRSSTQIHTHTQYTQLIVLVSFLLLEIRTV